MKYFLLPAITILASLILGSVFILAAGVNPLNVYYWLFGAGFGCKGSGGFCAILRWTLSKSM